MRRFALLLALLPLAAGCGVLQPSPAAPRAGALAASAAGVYLGAHFRGRAPVTDDGATEGQEGAGGLEAAASLPARVDLRAQMPPVYDQGPMSSCTGWAVACGLGEYLLKQAGQSTHLSARFIYWQARRHVAPVFKPEIRVDADTGADIGDAVDALDAFGACPEAAFAYPDVAAMRADPSSLDELAAVRPDAAATNAAKKFRLISGKTPVRTFHAMRKSLADGMPVVCGMLYYESFKTDAVKATGRVPLPKLGQEKLLGGHAVLVVGYDTPKRELIIRNSYGAAWGDKGYFTLPYAALKLRDTSLNDPRRPQGYTVLYDAWAAKR
jgi:C1A family cysteine protease